MGERAKAYKKKRVDENAVIPCVIKGCGGIFPKNYTHWRKIK